MKISVMGPAERDCELVADLESHRAGLREFQMMGVSGTSPANQTGLYATNLRWPLSRCRRGSLIMSTLLSILAGVASARRRVEAGWLSSLVGFDGTEGAADWSAAALTFLGHPLGRSG